MKQITNSILMIRPIGFSYNRQTAVNNYYQRNLDNISDIEIQEKALNEFDLFTNKLRCAGVNVIIIDDHEINNTPDAIFPNNWVSFHSNKRVCLFPMYAENRRKERRKDIFDILVQQHNFVIEEFKDLTHLEDEGKFLEGTGSMVLDRDNRICYAAISIRTNEMAVIKFCQEFNYTPICFVANQDVNGIRMPIYHTNVMMCIGDNFSIICLDSIDNLEDREKVVNSLQKTGKHIIEITEQQKHRFAGNMLQVIGDRDYLVMSNSAYNCLTLDQKIDIEKYSSILYSSLDTIEACGGGSARCMMAEIFLPKENDDKKYIT